jgi:hypothetical protein
MLSPSRHLRPTVREILELCHDTVFSGLLYSFVHPHLSLLPAIASPGEKNATIDSLVTISDDLDDILFMIREKPKDTRDCEMIYERTLLGLLQSSQSSKEQTIALSCLVQMLTKSDHESPSFHTIIYPLLLDLFTRLSCDCKVRVLKLTTRMPVPEDGDTRRFMATRLLEKLKMETQARILLSGYECLNFLSPKDSDNSFQVTIGMHSKLLRLSMKI